jgi:1,4-dihydroxy-6-naphthoate synthase
MKLTLGFSPCPNDTFIFDALVNKKIDTEGFDLEVYLEDVQTLNEWAMEGRLDVSKISYGVLPLVLDQYDYLNSGGALGKGVGPLLIARSSIPREAIPNCTIAIPGENTTAHLLFSQAFPDAKNKVFKVFNEIEDAVLNNEVDAGVIIHENRFTYQQRGLHKIIDLGEYWEQTTGLPIPLGGIVARKSLGAHATHIDRLIRASVEYAFKHHHKHLSDYVKQHAQEMSEDVMRQHVDLYVNEYSMDLGEKGKQAIEQLLAVA